MSLTRLPEFTAALARAGDELGLQEYYRSSVRPLFGMPRSQWPACCGGGCEPCAQTLVAVAERVCELLQGCPEMRDMTAFGKGADAGRSST